jgi:hypothetical protein
VSPIYIFDEAETGRGALPAEVAVALQDDVLRDLAMRAAGLSEYSLKAISDLIDSARILEAPRARRPARRGGGSGQAVDGAASHEPTYIAPPSHGERSDPA